MKPTMFKPVDTKIDFPKQEEEILKFWKQENIFEKSIAARPEEKQWNFLDGPPFVTGLPHYGHLLTSIAKDLFPRYWTMKGFRVRRVWGWDGHGLPIENKVENKLEIKRKKDIEDVIGVGKFIELCKEYVEEVSDEWEWYIDHIARWVDFKNAYKTWNLDYMESVMWVFKQMYEKGYIYKGLRVSLYCPHCSTPISNFEVAMDADNYKEIDDHGTTYKYQLKDEKDTYILAWSTTPWNKIVTPALAVNPKLTYVKVKQGDAYYILAKSTIQMLLDEPKYTIVEEFKGTKLLGKTFVPHYDYYKIDEGKDAFIIIGGDFVTADEGTGVVTIAAYGEEDLIAMQKDNIHIEMHVDEEGTIKPDVPEFGGMYYLKANKVVNADLEKRGLIYKDVVYPHNVPLCWRCHTRLYYAPQNAWYVNVQQLKVQMRATNEEIHWYPKHFKHGRFEKSLEAAPDWCISRNRYWGSPIPVWECICGERFVPGSIQELEEASGQTITDLHKPGIDEVVVTCKKCGEKVKRVTEVLDSWIEAGSATFAERHFPFNTDEKLESFFPPDFIVEYTGQIRAWFYVLHVISNAIYEKKAFKNVLVNGVILGTDGRKMSKNYGNYPDPKELLQKYGGDALRLYLMSSPVIRGEDMVISEENYRNQVKGMLLVLWNIYNFFITYANIDGWDKNGKSNTPSENILDKWIMSLLHTLIKNVTADLDGYNSVTAIEHIQAFVDDFSKWYIRRSRDRVGLSATDEHDKVQFYTTTSVVLETLCKLLAPITPFITEAMYQNLTGEESVHLTDWPQVQTTAVDAQLDTDMQIAREIVERAHAVRKQLQLKVRQPLAQLRVQAPEVIDAALRQVIADEVNVKEVLFKKNDTLDVEFDTEITGALRSEGEARDLIRSIQEERKKIGTTLNEKVRVTLPSWPADFEDYIKTQALIETLSKGESLAVSRLHEK
jgi:isoleucyl-tRNA synthetase